MNELAACMVKDNIINAKHAPLFSRLFDFVEKGTPMPKKEFARWTKIGLLRQRGKGDWYMAIDSDPEDAAMVGIEFVMALMQYQGLVVKRYKEA